MSLKEKVKKIKEAKQIIREDGTVSIVLDIDGDGKNSFEFNLYTKEIPAEVFKRGEKHRVEGAQVANFDFEGFGGFEFALDPNKDGKKLLSVKANLPELGDELF